MLLSFEVHVLYHIPSNKSLIFLNLMDRSKIITEKVITASAFVILAAVFLSLVWNNNVWMDEAFTASLVHTDFAHVISRSMADTLPPLYNIILKLMTVAFGYRIEVMKITSVIPMILTLFIGASVVRRRFGFLTSLLFMIFVTFMPLMLYFGVEIRMYSLGFFFATASGIYAYEVVKSPSHRSWTGFVAFSVLAGYSHHFAFVTVAFSYLYLLLYFLFFAGKRIKEWFICLLATFVLYLPCLIVTISQISMVNGYFSMPDVDLAMFVQYMIYPFTVGITPASVLCLLIMIVSLALIIRDIVIKKTGNADMIFALCCFTVYYGVLIFGTVISKLMSANIFVDRYLFFATGLLWLSAAVVLGRSKKLCIVSIVAALAVGACTYYVMYNTEYARTADEEIEFLRDNIGEGDVYYSIGGHEEMQNCIPFYTYLDPDTAELEFVYPLTEAVRVAEERGTTLWVSVLDGFAPSDEDMKILQEHGLILDKKADFEFDRYRCGFYRANRQSFVKK